MNALGWAWLAIGLFIASIWLGVAVMVGVCGSAGLLKLGLVTIAAGLEAHHRMQEVEG